TIGAAGLWDELETDWLLLDAELMPWSLKAQGLLRHQYAAVGAASGAVFPGAIAALESAAERGVDVSGLLDRQRERAADAAAFTEAYRRYCWTTGDSAQGWPGEQAETQSLRRVGAKGTDGLDGIRMAPFQILAVQGRSLAALPHDEQLALIDRMIEAEMYGSESNNGICAYTPVYMNRLLAPTRRLVVDTEDEASVAAGVQWWLDLTGAGGEGMVVKPLQALVRTAGGRLVQPGVKCRGREYLRIIYGPEYTRPDNLARLRARHLGHKRSLALREYALGLEALDRLAAGEPLWRVHEAVFGVLALESEPVDPRL
ncbi:polynucleotide kinase-phosphatase, partial [Streptomyces sp. AA8]|nr:polynucleotide kinase-phosphatase [Streptomyces telluris]